MSSSSVATLKKELRARALVQRATLAARPDAQAEAVSLAMAWRRWLEHKHSRQHIAVYAAVRGELDCSRLCKTSRRLGHHTYYPRVRPQRHLAMVEVRDEMRDLRTSNWGIGEPLGSPVSPRLLDVILVPGVCFDRWGGRLGFGGGYYDRLIASVRSMTPYSIMIGVCRTAALAKTRLPRDAHDQRVDALLTPQGIISCI